MTWAADAAAIRAHLAANWPGTVAGQAVPLRFADNNPPPEPFPLPSVAVTIIDAERLPAALGTGYRRGVGLLIAQVFTPENSGGHLPRQIADALDALLGNRRLGNVTFFDGARPAAVGPRAGMHQRNYEFPFTSENFA